MEKTVKAAVTRRGMMRTGAVALAAVPTLAVGGLRLTRIEPFETMSFEEWSKYSGMMLRVVGESGVVAATVASVTAMPSEGQRPRDLARAGAFNVTLDLEIAAAPSGDALYEVWMGPVRSGLFLQRRGDVDGRARMSAVFN